MQCLDCGSFLAHSYISDDSPRRSVYRCTWSQHAERYYWRSADRLVLVKPVNAGSGRDRLWFAEPIAA